MNNPETKSQILSLKRPSRSILREIDGALSASWNLTPKNEDEVGFRSYQNGICGISVGHSRKEGVLVVAVTSLSSKMGGCETLAAVKNVEAIQDTLQSVYGSCDVRPNWVGTGRGAVLAFGDSHSEGGSKKIEEIKPRVVSILPHRSFP